MADLRGPPAPPPRTAQNFFNFMRFLEIFGKIIGWRPLEGWQPLLRGILDLPLQRVPHVPLNIIREGITCTRNHLKDGRKPFLNQAFHYDILVADPGFSAGGGGSANPRLGVLTYHLA